MNIILAAPSTLPARRANTVQVMKMTQALADIGHAVTLLVPHPGVPKPVKLAAIPSTPPASGLALPGWSELASRYGLPGPQQGVDSPPFDLAWLPARPGWRGLDFAFGAVRWAARSDADLFFTRVPQAAALASLLGHRTIFEAHSMPEGRFGPWYVQAFLRGRGAVRLVSITRALAEDLARAFPLLARRSAAADFLMVAPDGVDLARYAAQPEPAPARAALNPHLALSSLPPLPERFTAGYTGHLYPGRGAEMLVQLARRLPQVNFLLVGGEPADIERVRQQASGLPNLWLTGFVPNADLPKYQAACNALLMPYQRQVSASSGAEIGRYFSPMKLFEYLACGRAVVCSDLPVLHEALSPENCLFVPPDDPAAWVQALETLASKPDLAARLAAQARADAQNYTWQARAEKITGGLP